MSARLLVVVADDFGIGPATDQGILTAATAGAITGAALLVNSPYAGEAVRAWDSADRPFELGWHANLTLDRPILPPQRIPTLVNHDGQFHSLTTFLVRWLLGRIDPDDVADEWRAQLQRFIELVGQPPMLVNAHQHVCAFPPLGERLLAVLDHCRPRPMLRRVIEPWSAILKVAGARGKRVWLNHLGRRLARQSDRRGYPGAQCLAGIANPLDLADSDYWPRRLAELSAASGELITHPGFRDESLWGRDLAPGDELGLQRRVNELHRLLDPSFRAACERHRFQIVSPSSLSGRRLVTRLARSVAA